MAKEEDPFYRNNTTSTTTLTFAPHIVEVLTGSSSDNQRFSHTNAKIFSISARDKNSLSTLSRDINRDRAARKNSSKRTTTQSTMAKRAASSQKKQAQPINQWKVADRGGKKRGTEKSSEQVKPKSAQKLIQKNRRGTASPAGTAKSVRKQWHNSNRTKAWSCRTKGRVRVRRSSEEGQRPKVSTPQKGS